MKYFENRTIKIYTLYNPISKDIFWVGQTAGELEVRLKGHIRESEENAVSNKREIIKSIISLGEKPIIEEVESFTCNSINDKILINYMEEYWIGQYKAWGFPLQNVHGGRIEYINKEKRLLERNYLNGTYGKGLSHEKAN